MYSDIYDKGFGVNLNWFLCNASFHIYFYDFLDGLKTTFEILLVTGIYLLYDQTDKLLPLLNFQMESWKSNCKVT